MVAEFRISHLAMATARADRVRSLRDVEQPDPHRKKLVHEKPLVHAFRNPSAPRDVHDVLFEYYNSDYQERYVRQNNIPVSYEEIMKRLRCALPTTYEGESLLLVALTDMCVHACRRATSTPAAPVHGREDRVMGAARHDNL